MAKQNKFLLVSLKEDQAKRLAQVIGNETCRKILDFMSEKESVTESEIAKEMDIPLSTVHYNLQHMKKGGLIESENFHYSEKGREVHHWRLANKYIVIAPSSIWGIKEKLKSMLPVVGLAGGVAIAMQYFGKSVSLAATKADVFVQESEAAPMALRALPEAMPAMQTSPNMGIWFFIGAAVAIAGYLAVDYVRFKMKK